MISAFTLVKVASQRSALVYERLRRLPPVEEATLVYGEYDIIVKTNTKSIGELSKFVYSVLRKTPHITMTTTMIAAHIPRKKKAGP